MTRAVAERLSLLLSVVGALTFIVGLASSSQGLVALGVVGFVYVVSVLPMSVVLVIATDFGRGMWKWMILAWPVLIAGMLLAPPTLTQRSLDSFGIYQLVGATMLACAMSIFATLVYVRYRDTHKECPECAETVLARAKVCRHCGFRWEAGPPLPEATYG